MNAEIPSKLGDFLVDQESHILPLPNELITAIQGGDTSVRLNQAVMAYRGYHSKGGLSKIMLSEKAFLHPVQYDLFIVPYVQVHFRRYGEIALVSWNGQSDRNVRQRMSEIAFLVSMNRRKTITGAFPIPRNI